MPDALQIIYKPTGSLIPYARNAKKHPPAQVAEIAASIRQFGFNAPVLLDESDGIIAGHGRVLAAGLLKMDKVPTIALPHLTGAQKQAYILADNKLTERGGWDADMLRIELLDLQEQGFDVEITGFKDDELAKLIGPKGEGGLTDPDAVGDIPSIPVSRIGDVWILGSHRLVCGDATMEADVAAALNGVKPHLMVTDPPYGVNYDPTWRHEVGANNSARVGKVMNDDRSDWREAWALFPGDVVYVWHGALHAANVADSLRETGFGIRAQIIWRKQRFVFGRGDYHWQHEPCWYAVRQGAKGHYSGDRKQSTIWDIDNASGAHGDKDDAATIHSTQKPVECMRRPIENNSSPGQAVYEPFSGSGTTIIACEMTGRSCHAVELDPAYVDVAIGRWQEFTGKPAVLEATGKMFAEVLAERVPTKPLGVRIVEPKPPKKPKGKK